MDEIPEIPPLKKKRRLKGLPLSRLVPNLVTISALCFGLSGVRYALDERWELSVTLILIAALLDGLDGRLARLLKASSDFGAQLDSLADFVNFGVAPGMVIYLWSSHEIKGVGWALALFFAVCTALRLARFNTNLFESQQEQKSDRFFIGVPAPAGAGLALVPLMAYFELAHPWLQLAWVNILWLALVAALMVSRVPTFSFKKVRIRHEYALPVMAVAGGFLALLFMEPWWTLVGVGVVYFLSLPFSISIARRLHRAV